MFAGKRKRIAATALLLALTVSGCAMTPQYVRPGLPVPAQLAGTTSGDAAETSSAIAAADVGWREVFTDPLLQQLIGTALENNRDLRVTSLNVEAYQAQYRIQRAAELPSVSGSGSGSRQRTLSGGGYATGETYTLNLGMTSYELDFYGRVRDLKEQALQQYLAMEETRKSAALSLISQVAQGYLTWLADRELLQITMDTRQSEEESYRLIEQRVEAGVANELDLAQARTSLETVKANQALYQRQVALDRNGLALLIGAPLPETMDGQQSLLSKVALVAPTPTSLSSDVLLQRPDIIAAEHELIGANANIGAARAAFFPTIRLTTSIGLISTDLGDLFDSNSGSWAFTPSISLPIFNGGQLDAQLDVAKISKDIAVAQYEKAIQSAFQEVSDALVSVDSYRDQLAAQQANLTANEEYYSRAKDRYQEGVDSFLTLLDAQRSLYSSRQTYLSLKLAQLVNQVNLYKALGGGVKE